MTIIGIVLLGCAIWGLFYALEKWLAKPCKHILVPGETKCLRCGKAID